MSIKFYLHSQKRMQIFIFRKAHNFNGILQTKGQEAEIILKMTKDEYAKYIRLTEPHSPILKDVLCAFLIGGAICTFSQLLQNLYGLTGLNPEMSGTAASVTLIFLSALLTGLSVFDDIARVAGAGTLVPITGFANAVVSPAMEFRSEGLVTGLASKMFVVAGPVLVYGIGSSVVFGIIYWLIGLF